MFDIDAGKILILGVIALVILGPKELPRVMRQVGNALGKMRRMAAEFQTQFMDAMKESEMAELKKDMQKMADQAKVDINYDPVSETNRQIREAIDGKPAHEITASTPVPVDPDPDNKIYTADIPPVAPPVTPPAQSPAPLAEASVEPATTQPARKTGEA
jgi:sec-independent protein translocase protein TatB